MGHALSQLNAILEAVRFVPRTSAPSIAGSHSIIDTEPEAHYTASRSVQTKHILNRLYQVNTTALVSLACRLRNGISCSIPALVPDRQGNLNVETILSQTGGQNCNIDIRFQDGIVWMARIRLDDPLLPPKPTQEYISLSETLTLKYLESTGVPVPKVFHFASESSENLVGVPLLLMEKMKGAPPDVGYDDT
ncbi:MAG: hypothetical protein M1819_004052 [Sarea resinae]|nr:MAG: hypothetical protein M1819_004052 [Sarea resinae]